MHALLSVSEQFVPRALLPVSPQEPPLHAAILHSALAGHDVPSATAVPPEHAQLQLIVPVLGTTQGFEALLSHVVPTASGVQITSGGGAQEPWQPPQKSIPPPVGHVLVEPQLFVAEVIEQQLEHVAAVVQLGLAVEQEPPPHETEPLPEHVAVTPSQLAPLQLGGLVDVSQPASHEADAHVWFARAWRESENVKTALPKITRQRIQNFQGR